MHIARSSQRLSVNCEQEDEDGLEWPMGGKAAKKRKGMASESQNEAPKIFFHQYESAYVYIS